jgi:hypothetical protein
VRRGVDAARESVVKPHVDLPAQLPQEIVVIRSTFLVRPNLTPYSDASSKNTIYQGGYVGGAILTPAEEDNGDGVSVARVHRVDGTEVLKEVERPSGSCLCGEVRKRGMEEGWRWKGPAACRSGCGSRERGSRW